MARKEKERKNERIRKTSLVAIAMVLFVTVFTSIGQILFKISSKNLALDFYALITNYTLIIGFALYFIGAVILVLAMRKGELSVLYPFVALSFVWVSLLSAYFLGEGITVLKWVGVAGIVIGVSVIGAGSK